MKKLRLFVDAFWVLLWAQLFFSAYIVRGIFDPVSPTMAVVSCLVSATVIVGASSLWKWPYYIISAAIFFYVSNGLDLTHGWVMGAVFFWFLCFVALLVMEWRARGSV